MTTLWLRVRAPFAAFRAFQAGVYRGTSPIMPPSTAFGLILNLAGIEMRESTEEAMTRIRKDVPNLRIAVGLISPSTKNSLYQQLHSYPVGTSGKELAKKTHGAKYWIVPVRREMLVDYDGMIGAQAEDEKMLERAKRGLRGDLNESRYGLPFAGDNNFLFDCIDVIGEPPAETLWYTHILPGGLPRKGSYRLTIGIDRADNSRTSSRLFAPHHILQSSPPEEAWTWTPVPPDSA